MKGKKTIKHIKNSIKNLFSGRKSRFLSGGKTKKSMKSFKKNIQNLQRQRSRSLALALAGGRGRGGKTRTRSRRHLKGGYSQYQNNLPMTNVYSLADVNLSASESALANPPPYQPLSNCVNCVDNYNHYTNMGFPSRGH